MRDVDNNLSAVIVEPTSTASCGDSNQNIMLDNLSDVATAKNYSQLRDKLWEVIEKEIGMSQCDIYRFVILIFIKIHLIISYILIAIHLTCDRIHLVKMDAYGHLTIFFTTKNSSEFYFLPVVA